MKIISIVALIASLGLVILGHYLCMTYSDEIIRFDSFEQLDKK